MQNRRNFLRNVIGASSLGLLAKPSLSVAVSNEKRIKENVADVLLTHDFIPRVDLPFDKLFEVTKFEDGQDTDYPIDFLSKDNINYDIVRNHSKIPERHIRHNGYAHIFTMPIGICGETPEEVVKGINNKVTLTAKRTLEVAATDNLIIEANDVQSFQKEAYKYFSVTEAKELKLYKTDNYYIVARKRFLSGCVIPYRHCYYYENQNGCPKEVRFKAFAEIGWAVLNNRDFVAGKITKEMEKII